MSRRRFRLTSVRVDGQSLYRPPNWAPETGIPDGGIHIDEYMLQRLIEGKVGQAFEITIVEVEPE